MNRSLDYRRDKRSQQAFERDIQRRTAKERYLALLFVREMEFLGYPIVEMVDTGVGNDGKLVEQSRTTPDYLFKFENGSRLLCDIKCSPVSDKLTFKVYLLQQYIRQKASLLVFYGTGFIDHDLTKVNFGTTRWCVIRPHVIQRMLEDCTPYNEPKFGDKPCIRVMKIDFCKYFEEHKLTCMQN